MDAFELDKTCPDYNLLFCSLTEVHHVDGDRTNNEVDNLQLLCCNCHALTENWRRVKK